MAKKNKSRAKEIIRMINIATGPIVTPRSKCWDQRDTPRKTQKQQFDRESRERGFFRLWDLFIATRLIIC